MRELVIISGKGGTGKTSVTGALASIVPNSVLVDCDVDAADLHLLLSPEIIDENDYIEGQVASIDIERCRQCMKCVEHCRFDAINEDLVVDGISCEGCGLCSRICPAEAIQMLPRNSGRWYISNTRYGKMVHARLGTGEGNSGKLVFELRDCAKGIAEDEGAEYILVDGPPGIGCPVISSVTGADAVLIVTEPTMSGLHDLKRVSELARHFEISQFVCVNKADINRELTEEIKSNCRELGALFVAEIGYDIEVTRAQTAAMVITEYSKRSDTSVMIKEMWERISNELKNN